MFFLHQVSLSYSWQLESKHLQLNRCENKHNDNEKQREEKKKQNKKKTPIIYEISPTSAKSHPVPQKSV